MLLFCYLYLLVGFFKGAVLKACKTDSCEQKVHARGLCKGCYSHWWLGGGTGKLCSVDGCNKPLRSKGYCGTHYERLRAHGDHTIVLKTGPPPSSNPSYKVVHRQLKDTIGVARDFLCHCGQRADEWAYDYTDPRPLLEPDFGSLYSTDLGRYIPMCIPCHRKLDSSGGCLIGDCSTRVWRIVTRGRLKPPLAQI
jgi:hypothetical protein